MELPKRIALGKGAQRSEKIMIEFNNVSARVGGRTILKRVSLHVPAGQCLGLLGPSGSGKTTLLRLLAGFEKPDSGAIRINNEVVSSAGILTPPYSRSVGMVFQDLALWPHMTVRRQLEFASGPDKTGRKERNRKIRNALARVRLESYEKSYPHQLSGGEKQRLALARALIQEPEILLLDEPFSSLDMGLRNELLPEIRKIIREMKMTCIFVTHLIPEAEFLAERILMIQDGQIIPRQLQKSEKVAVGHERQELVCHLGGRGR
jgi:iron(III) transport system ATP-binding protein